MTAIHTVHTQRLRLRASELGSSLTIHVALRINVYNVVRHVAIHEMACQNLFDPGIGLMRLALGVACRVHRQFRGTDSNAAESPEPITL